MRPYSYQTTCLSALATARQGGSNKELVVMATGLGKTMVAAFDIKRLLEKAPGRVLYLCHQNHILAQARKTFETVLGRGHSFGNFHGTEKHLHNVDVLFASFQTMANWRDAFMQDEFRYVVVDEVHHAQAETFRPTVQYFTPDFMLGLTATLKRADGLDVGELFNGKPVFELDLYEALARGYLCDVDYRIMTDEVQAAGVLDTPVGKLSIAHLNRTIFIPKRDEEIARIIAEKTAHIQSPRVMVFCSSIQHAENMASLIPGAKVVHSKLKGKEKDNRLAAFRCGTTTTVATIDMFNEGIDVPEANVIVFLRSTASETIYLQQFGRGLRKADDKDNVLVLDFVANCERIEMVRELDARVRQFREEMAQETSAEANPEVTNDSEPRNPLILTLDGVEFDERTWGLFGVIEELRFRSYGYTRDELIEQLKQKAQELGRTPKASEVNADNKMAAATTLANTFGTYNNALEAAGLEAIQYKRYFTREELLEQLRVKSRKLGKTPTMADVKDDPLMADVGTYKRALGVTTWNEAIVLAGLAPTRMGKKRTVNELKAMLLDKSERLGRTPTHRDIVDDKSMPHPDTFTATFGMKLYDILVQLGLTPRKRSSYTADELVTLLKRRQEELGRSLGRNQAERDPELPSVPTFLRVMRCKSWAEVLVRAAAAGVGAQNSKELPPQTAEITPSDLLTQVLTKAKSLGRPPRAGEVDADSAMASAKEIKVALRASNWTEVISHIKPYL